MVNKRVYYRTAGCPLLLRTYPIMAQGTSEMERWKTQVFGAALPLVHAVSSMTTQSPLVELRRSRTASRSMVSTIFPDGRSGSELVFSSSELGAGSLPFSVTPLHLLGLRRWILGITSLREKRPPSGSQRVECKFFHRYLSITVASISIISQNEPGWKCELSYAFDMNADPSLCSLLLVSLLRFCYGVYEYLTCYAGYGIVRCIQLELQYW